MDPGEDRLVSVDPSTGHVYAIGGPLNINKSIDSYSLKELEASGSSAKTISTMALGFGEEPRGLAVDGASGRVYVASLHDVLVYGPTVTVPDVTSGTATITGDTSVSLGGAVNPDGVPLEECYFEYGLTTSYGQVAPCAAPDATEVGTGHGAVDVHADLAGLAPESLYHYRLVAKNANAAIPGGDRTFKSPGKPTIGDEWAASVTRDGALLKATVIPENSAGSYVFEWGTGPGYANKDAGGTFPADTKEHTVSILLSGLQPDTAYHFRIVATNGIGETEGADQVFHTWPELGTPDTSCPNQALRPGPVALLPDCRAYEMVSPLDKNGSDISVLPNVTGFPAGLDQAALSGEGLTYSAYRAFGDAPGGGYTSQYLATRDPGTGWSSHSVSAPREGGTFLQSALLDREYRALSPDLSEGWVFRETDPLLDEAAPSGYANLYRRAADGSYEAAVRGEPIGAAAGSFVPELQGEGGGCTVFTAKAKLTANASAAGGSQLYETCEGTTSLVSVLPSGSAAPAASAGTSRGDANRGDALHNAVSADGSTVFWSNAAGGTGKLFARIGGSETLALSKSSARFLTAAADGSKAIFTEGEKLFSFTVGTNKKEAPTLIAEGFLGFLGAGEDASHIYFLSKEELAPGAEAGKPNLYLYEAGEAPTFTYIATLAAADAVTEGLAQATPVSLIPTSHTAQATADGGALVFDSVAPLTGFDNTDQKSGEPDLEVFVYRAATGSLLCASCDPSAQRPEGREIVPSGQPNGRKQPVAATIPVAGSSLYTPRAISEDGTRAFFTSYVPLALRDTNGKADVYEWEAEGHGDCTAAAPGYDPAWGGCVNLISSGDSPSDSVLVDSGADGRDVFFKTYSSLVPQDPGLRDIYDAREGGGFPPPPVPAAACEGEACQGPVSPPDDPTPASSAFQGAGNVREEAKPAKKKHKHKKHHKKHHKKNPEQRANAKQRSGK